VDWWSYGEVAVEMVVVRGEGGVSGVVVAMMVAVELRWWWKLRWQLR
jgi:hypothetical protein